MGEPAANAAEGAIQIVRGQARTSLSALEHEAGEVSRTADVTRWLTQWSAMMLALCRVGTDGKTPLQRLMGEEKPHTNNRVWRERLLQDHTPFPKTDARQVGDRLADWSVARAQAPELRTLDRNSRGHCQGLCGRATSRGSKMVRRCRPRSAGHASKTNARSRR